MYDSATHAEGMGWTHEDDELNDEPLCPYCKAELEQRDTFGIGGDQVYEWCPDCQRVIEETEITKEVGHE